MKGWALAVFTLLTLTACGGSGDTSSTPAKESVSSAMVWDQDNWDKKNWE